MTGSEIVATIPTYSTAFGQFDDKVSLFFGGELAISQRGPMFLGVEATPINDNNAGTPCFLCVIGPLSNSSRMRSFLWATNELSNEVPRIDEWNRK